MLSLYKDDNEGSKYHTSVYVLLLENKILLA